MGRRDKRLRSAGPHQESLQAANPEVPLAIGQNRGPMVWKNAGFAAENGQAFRAQAAQPVTAAKPRRTRRIDVHAVSRAVLDLLGSGMQAELIALAPRLANIQSAAGRHIKPPLAIGGQAGLSVHSEVPR